MGKKDEQIRLLEDRIRGIERVAETQWALISTLGEVLGVPVDDGITMATLPRYVAAFTNAIGQQRKPYSGTGLVPDGITMATGLVPFDALVDSEVERINQTGADVQERDKTLMALLTIAHEIGGIEGIEASTPATSDLAAAILHKMRTLRGGASTSEDDSEDAPIDSLAAAIHHNQRERATLADQLVQTRIILNRVASAMQIDRWDRDGTELLERAQRWENFKYTLKREILAAQETRGPHEVSILNSPRGYAANVLKRLLGMLVAPKQLAEWFGKVPADVAGVPGVMDLANDRPDIILPTLTPQDIEQTTDAATDFTGWMIRQGSGFMDDDVSERLFSKMGDSLVARRALADLINIVVLPILKKEIGT